MFLFGFMAAFEPPAERFTSVSLQLGGFAFIGEGIPVGLGAAFRAKYMRVSFLVGPCHHVSLSAVPQVPQALCTSTCCSCVPAF